MTGHQHVRAGHRGDDAALLAAGHQVVDQHAEAAAGPGPEGRDLGGQVVDAVERLDDDALDPQVVAPDPLDQLRIVLALDPDAAATEPEAVRVLATGTAPTGRTRVTGTPSSRNPAGSSGKTRTLPRRSSSETRSLSHSTTAPPQPVPASSTTSP